MKLSFKTGLSFGLTSGVITTLGLMVGLHSGTHSRTVVIGGIVTIARLPPPYPMRWAFTWRRSPRTMGPCRRSGKRPQPPL
jgi:hypothetical protein